jgi:hypothetical protein
MKKSFATSFAFLAAFYTSAVGESNFSATYEEESDSFLLSSGNLGLLNNEVNRLQSEVKAGNEAQQELATKHATELADLKATHSAALEAKQAELVKVQNELAVLKGEKPADDATGVGADADPGNENRKKGGKSLAGVSNYLKTTF